jgi:hypothetical protein
MMRWRCRCWIESIISQLWKKEIDLFKDYPHKSPIRAMRFCWVINAYDKNWGGLGPAGIRMIWLCSMKTINFGKKSSANFILSKSVTIRYFSHLIANKWNEWFNFWCSFWSLKTELQRNQDIHRKSAILIFYDLVPKFESVLRIFMLNVSFKIKSVSWTIN